MSVEKLEKIIREWREAGEVNKSLSFAAGRAIKEYVAEGGSLPIELLGRFYDDTNYHKTLAEIMEDEMDIAEVDDIVSEYIDEFGGDE